MASVTYNVYVGNRGYELEREFDKKNEAIAYALRLQKTFIGDPMNRRVKVFKETSQLVCDAKEELSL